MDVEPFVHGMFFATFHRQICLLKVVAIKATTKPVEQSSIRHFVHFLCIMHLPPGCMCNVLEQWYLKFSDQDPLF